MIKLEYAPAVVIGCLHFALPPKGPFSPPTRAPPPQGPPLKGPLGLRAPSGAPEGGAKGPFRGCDPQGAPLSRAGGYMTIYAILA